MVDWEAQVSRRDINALHTLTIDGIDYTDFLISWDISVSREFGASAASFVLDNNDASFNEGGSRQIDVGAVVQLIEKYVGDTDNWKRFYGTVIQRATTKSKGRREIALTCLDYIAGLQALDIDLLVEGTKVEVLNETLTPNFLPVPNDKLAQVFDFSKDAIAIDPRPVIVIRDLTNNLDNLQFDGFEVIYQTGQVKLGAPLNASTNFSILARSYHYYVAGVYVEDILEKILTQVDGYGKFLFGETTATLVIDNHLKDTFLNVEGGTTDTMVPNFTPSTITIRHTLASAVSAGDSTASLDSADGLPTSGTAEINGDVFTWTSISSGNVLTGIPSSGANALKAHAAADLVMFEKLYPAGQLWSLKYSNLVTTLVDANFTIPGATMDYLDKRFGRIVLDVAISTSLTVQCNVDYTFKTLQASGIELNRISFRSREVENRYDAIQKLMRYVAPNYVIRTQGDDKIWASLLSQKVTADFALDLIEEIDYLEDEDIFTRVVMYGKNSNPTNLMFDNATDFVSTGETYRAIATDNTLTLLGTEGNFFKYGNLLSGVGYIDITNITPVVKVNGIAIDNQVHRLFQQPVLVELTTRTETRTGCHGISKEHYVKSHTFFYYKVHFAHGSIVSSQPILLHNANGTTLFTLAANDTGVDYANGVWVVPGDSENANVTLIASATYSILYASNLLVIDFENAIFKIDKSLIIDPNQVEVKATFEYWTVFINVFDVAAIIDGRHDTQVQVEFFAEPPSGFGLAIIDLGQEFQIQALDIVAGFFKPDSVRKFDIDMRFTIQWSTNGSDFFEIGDTTNNVKLSGGESISFEEDALGSDFKARYLKIILDNAKKIDFGNGIWVVAFTEIAAYNNIVLKANATLIPTTQLVGNHDISATTLVVKDTTGFTDVESSETLTAFIAGDSFTYTGLTATTFTGVTLSDSYIDDDRVSKALSGDSTIYDDRALLPKLGDRLFKDIRISDTALFDQEQIDRIARSFLKEFIKNHTKRRVRTTYSPHLRVGHTVSLTDTYGHETAQRYFVESVGDRNGFFQLTIAQYPGD